MDVKRFEVILEDPFQGIRGNAHMWCFHHVPNIAGTMIVQQTQRLIRERGVEYRQPQVIAGLPEWMYSPTTIFLATQTFNGIFIPADTELGGYVCVARSYFSEVGEVFLIE